MDDKKISYNKANNVYFVKNESKVARFYKDYSQLIFIITIPLFASILPLSLKNKVTNFLQITFFL